MKASFRLTTRLASRLRPSVGDRHHREQRTPAMLGRMDHGALLDPVRIVASFDSLPTCASQQDTRPAQAAKTGSHRQSGEDLFDEQTFGGNGRTCATCHSQKTGTFSIQEAQARYAKNPNDTLFRQPDSDDGDGRTYDRLLTTATVRIDIPLPPNVRLLDDPTTRTVTFFRATPTVKNVTTLQAFLMSGGRESSSDLQHQAQGAIHQHTQNTIEPTAAQLDKIAAFERTDERFFSSEALQRYAQGGPPPKLPRGNTPSERQGREFFNANRQCGVCHSGPMLDTSSEFDFLTAPGSHSHTAGAGFQLGPPAQAVDADNNLLLEPTNPNRNHTFEFTMPDGSTRSRPRPSAHYWQLL